jgi:hypothetical protein
MNRDETFACAVLLKAPGRAADLLSRLPEERRGSVEAFLAENSAASPEHIRQQWLSAHLAECARRWNKLVERDPRLGGCSPRLRRWLMDTAA